MAFTEQNPLDYRSGGDRVKNWGAKYKDEIPHIYNIINSIMKHQAYGDIAVQDEDGVMKIFTYQYEDQAGVVHTERHLAIGIQSGENFQWVDIGQIAPRFGAPLTEEALTEDDVATQPYEAYKLVRTNENGIMDVDISGSPAKMVGKVIAVNNLSDGQVMVWRSYDQKWHNENKAAVGEGKALELKNGETTICLYSGESDQSVDIGKWNNVTLVKLTDNVADIRYVATIETTSSQTAKLQKATPEAEGRTFAMRDTDGYLFATTPGTNDSSQKAATTANVAAKIAAHDGNSGAHVAAFASQLATFKTGTLGYRKKSSLYSVGMVAEYENLPTGWYLECSTQGTTSSTDLTLPETIAEGKTVNDGTAVWKIRKSASTNYVKDTLGYRKPSTIYAVKDIAYSDGLPTGWYLECKVAGTTDAGAITLPATIVENAEVTDGTVTWKIRKISSADGVPIATILAYSSNGELPSGYLLCDGSAVSRTMFPDLFAAIGTTYGAGDGSTTFNLPDYNTAQRFAQGGTVAGVEIAAGLPNITGNNGVNVQCSSAFASPAGTGALQSTSTGTQSYSVSSGNMNVFRLSIDASRSNPIYGNSDTVQPNALTTRYIIKAFDGQTADSALIDITQYAQELAGKANITGSNMVYHKDVITTSGTYTAPVTGLYKITVKGGGGGGAGGAYSSGNFYAGGGGGGEGGTTIAFEKMTAGGIATVVIGAGGTGGTANNNGSNGGDSSVTVNSNTYTGGGGGGATANPASNSGGGGGSGTILGATGIPGCGTNTTYTSQAFSLLGGSGGGHGGSTSASTAGNAGGGGCGGSAYYSSGKGAGAGGNGGDGYVWFEYYTPGA